jgi:hypothetical protein
MKERLTRALFLLASVSVAIVNILGVPEVFGAGGTGWGRMLVGASGYGLGVFAAALGAAIALRGSSRASTAVLVLFLLCLGLFLAEVAADGVPWLVGYPEGPTEVLSPWLLLAVAGLARVSATFPRVLRVEDLERWMGRKAALQPRAWVWSLTALGLAFPFVYRALGGDAWVTFLGQPFQIYVAYELVAMITFGSLSLLTWRDLRVQLLVGDAEERFQVYWLMQGLSVWVLSMALVSMWWVRSDLGAVPVGLAPALMVELAALAVLVAASFAVLVRGAIDPALVVSRTAVFGAFSTIALLSVAGAESLVSEMVERQLGLGGFAGPALTGVLMAAALMPFRGTIARHLQRWLESAPVMGEQPDEHEAP